MALDTFNPYLFVSSGEQSNKFLTPTYAGGIAKFQAQRAQSLTGLTVRFEPIQEGTGDPSPENIRPISGRTGLTVTVQSGEAQNEYPVTWESIAGTVYGGTLDVVSGVLTVDRVMETITKDGTWYGFVAGSGNASAAIQLRDYQNVKYVDGASSRNGAIASTGVEAQNYWVVARQNEIPPDGDMCFAYSSSGQLRFHRSDVANITDLETFKAAFPDTQIVYPLATPQTYQLTPTEVMTLAGFNQVYSDAGPVIDIKF